MPTVDEVIENLNDSSVFSKLDLRLGVHQIELEEDSRDITTFQWVVQVQEIDLWC